MKAGPSFEFSLLYFAMKCSYTKSQGRVVLLTTNYKEEKQW